MGSIVRLVLPLSCIAGLAAALEPHAHAQTPGTVQGAPCRNHLATVSPEGAAVAGSKDAVHAAASSGARLRVGWGFDVDGDGDLDLVHWADGEFVTLWRGEVFVQIAQIHRQSPVAGRGEVRLPEQLDFWSASLGTNGRLTGRLHSGPVSEQPVTSWWCLAESRG